MLSFGRSALVIILYMSAVGVLLPMSSLVAAQTPPVGARFRIAGTVVSANDGHALGQTRVSIFDTRNPKFRQSMITAEDGRFEFTQLKPGKYDLNGAKRGYIAAEYDQHEQFSTAIVTGSGLDTESLMLRLAPAAVLSGKVLDEAGDPVRHARVTLWREDHGSGVSRVIRTRDDSTDDLGFYEFTPLDGGTYFLSATANPWYAVHPTSRPEGTVNALTLVDRWLDVAYPTTYYGGATEWEDATPIPVRGGDRLEVDIHLAPLAALHLLFHSTPNPDQGFTMPIFQKQAFDGLAFLGGVEPQMVSPGLFELTGLLPGKYTVRIPASGDQSGQVSEILDLTQDSQELDMSSGLPVGSINASVEVPGEAKLPKGLAIALRDAQRRVVAWRPVDDKGEANFEELVPGKYEVRAGSPSKPYSVIRISSQSSKTSGHTLNVPPGTALKVTLSLIGGSVNVEGFVKHAGKAAPGAMVVLVPNNPDSNRELFRRDQSDLDGSFRLQSVIPGSYTVLAIENGWDLDWAQPATIENYARHGQKIKIGAKAETSLELSESIEVQPR
jgi:protocatechuate 3,4-dioxygenase beta subunit